MSRATETSSLIPLATRGVISLSGPDAKRLLQGLITNDIAALKPGQALYAALLTPQGKYLHDFFLMEQDGTIYLDCAADRRADLMRRLTMYRLRAQVEITDRTSELAVVALLGGAQLANSVFVQAIIANDPRDADLGQRAILPRTGLLALEGTTGEYADYEKLRLERGLPDGDRDFEIDRTLILEGNFSELNGVSFSKGCYVGQEMTTRMKHRGKVRKRLLPVRIEGPLPAPETPVMNGEKEIGQMRSGLDGIGMALLRLEDITWGKAYECGGAKVTPFLPDWLTLEEPAT